MATPLVGALPPGLHLLSGYLVRFNALSPTDGSQVTGVVVSQASIFVDNVGSGSPEDLGSGAFVLVAGPEG